MTKCFTSCRLFTLLALRILAQTAPAARPRPLAAPATQAADLVVLEKNLFNVPALEIHAVPMEYSITEGKVVYERKAARE